MSWPAFEADWFARFAVFSECPRVHKLAQITGLPYLPQHLHEILFFAGFYLVLYILTGPVLRRTTKFYAAQSPATRSGIATHVASEVNSLLLLALSYPLFGHPALPSLTSYTPYAGFVAAAASGYFLFDIIITLLWFNEIGVGFALHATSAFFVFMQGNRPFLHNYSAPYVWFEASTPFVNVHWLSKNVPGLISPNLETLNGVFLILVFMACRVIPGPYNGYKLFRVALFETLPGVPYWVVLVILVCYTVLTALNIYWFGKMLIVAFEVVTGKKGEIKNAEQRSTGKVLGEKAESVQEVSVGTSGADLREAHVRQRKETRRRKV